MASAVREAIRTSARMESENVRDQHLDTGGRIASSAFRRLRRVKIARGAADWLAGFEAGVAAATTFTPPGCAIVGHGPPDLSKGKLSGIGGRCDGPTPATAVDLAATTKDIKLRIERIGKFGADHAARSNPGRPARGLGRHHSQHCRVGKRHHPYETDMVAVTAVPRS